MTPRIQTISFLETFIRKYDSRKKEFFRYILCILFTYCSQFSHNSGTYIKIQLLQHIFIVSYGAKERENSEQLNTKCTRARINIPVYALKFFIHGSRET